MEGQLIARIRLLRNVGTFDSVAAGAALAAKRGKRSKSSLKGASRQMAKSMSKSELRRIAKTKRKGKPTRKRKKR